MKRIVLPALLLATLTSLPGCFQGDHQPTEDTANDAAGTGDDELAREVTGTWLLSTDYNYDQRCNYLPLEFVQSLFHIDESAKLEKYDLPNGCEVRWSGQRVGLYFEESSPYESVFQSEYAFDTLFQPRKVAQLDSNTVTPGVKPGSYHGPKPQGTGAERPAEGLSGAGVDASALNDTSTGLTHNNTPAAAHLVAPAEATPTGVPVSNVGDKALWEPRKRLLHVLYLNHIFHVQAPTKGDANTAREGAVNFAKYLIGHLNNASA